MGDWGARMVIKNDGRVDAMATWSFDAVGGSFVRSLFIHGAIDTLTRYCAQKKSLDCFRTVSSATGDLA